MLDQYKLLRATAIAFTAYEQTKYGHSFNEKKVANKLANILEELTLELPEHVVLAPQASWEAIYDAIAEVEFDLENMEVEDIAIALRTAQMMVQQLAA